MKKVLLALALLGVFMAGAAFASGHVDPAPFKPIVVESGDVPPPTGDAGVVSMDLQPAVQGDVPQQGIMELMGSGETAHILSAVKLELVYDNADGEAVIDLTKVIAKVKAATGTDPTVVWITNKKTGKVVVASDASERASFLHTLASNISQLAFDDLDGPVAVVGARNGITPAAELEESFFPQAEWIVDAIHERVLPLPGHVPTTRQATRSAGGAARPWAIT